MYSTFLSPRLGLEARLARRSHRKARATVYGARIQDKKTQGMSPIVYIALHEYMLINLTRFGVGKFSTQFLEDDRVQQKSIPRFRDPALRLRGEFTKPGIELLTNSVV